MTRVEKKKKYKRDPNLILRHLFEEIGELSNALWIYESEAKERSTGIRPEIVARELIDIISLANYLADVLGIDLNAEFPYRMKEVAKQYGITGIKL